MNAMRLFQLHLRLMDGETHTAAALAGELGSSERTVYRDIERLSNAGLPVKGSAGIGYRLPAPPALPPLLLADEEMRALVAGAYSVQSSGEAPAARAARSLLDKVRAIVPPRSRAMYGLKS